MASCVDWPCAGPRRVAAHMHTPSSTSQGGCSAWLDTAQVSEDKLLAVQALAALLELDAHAGLYHLLQPGSTAPLGEGHLDVTHRTLCTCKVQHASGHIIDQVRWTTVPGVSHGASLQRISMQYALNPSSQRDSVAQRAVTADMTGAGHCCCSYLRCGVQQALRRPCSLVQPRL